jgi:uncharacterized protein
MPVKPDYPGVYIEEISSGVHTITGVATSITAFVGRAQRGPVDQPVTIFSFGDYQRSFGGLWNLSTMSFAVRDFFLNGGNQAVIVRLFRQISDSDTGVAEISIPTNASSVSKELKLVASSPGEWGNNLEVAIDYETKDKTDENLFNITVFEIINKVVKNTEKFFNVTTDSSKGGYLPRVLEQNSSLIRVQGTIPGDRPLPTDKIIPESPPSSPPLTPPFITPLPVEVLVKGNNGNPITDVELIDGKTDEDMEGKKKGIYALERTDLFNILCIPPYGGDDKERPINVTTNLIGKAVKYCKKRRAIMIIDPQSSWTSKETAAQEFSDLIYPGLSGNARNYAALFFPRIKQANILVNNEIEEFVPCGMIAGVFSQIDAQRGVWKAPAGLEAGLNGITKFSVPLTDNENGVLNQLGINCLRSFPVYGNVIWGARTVEGADQLASEWKYIPVRRTALFIEESLYRGTKWVVFEPNDEPLWAQIRLNIGAFMHDLFRKGAFQGKTPKEAYLVKCDSETTTQNDINSGIVNILVGFAPLKPAEFVMIQIQQLAGQIET